MGVGHGADESAACRVLPVIDEEPDESEGSYSPEMMMTKQIAERRKAIVSRMRELLRRAAAAQSAHTKLRRSTMATAKKWKRVVGRIQNRGGHQRVVNLQQDDGMRPSVPSSISSSGKSSFSWDAAVETCSSANFSPLLFVSGRAESSDQLVSSPASSVNIRLSCTSARTSSGSDDEMRMAHWVTTDSDFVVLEL
ncbi:hypothetical protein QOZ80_2AG0099040 [Eleusine coracana subsp. coracana]|nr:hypothetical protein QOZ80_2AG0099040 [Eleusine coracana subsp. coracana]